MASDVCIITAYFNPCHYSSRKRNFEIFMERIRSIEAKVFAVEMALEGDDFELGDDCEILRLRGRGLLWQKERLLNIAISHLPASWRKVAWVDCDLLFEDDRWLEKTSRALDDFAIVQPFSSCVRLPRGWLHFEGQSHEAEQPAESFAAVFARDRSLSQKALYAGHGKTGFAWAARRELLDVCSLYDACLTGSGDHLMAHAFAGALNSPCIPKAIGVDDNYAKHFTHWATEAERMTNGSLGCVEGRALHLWHGEWADRRYQDRNQEFKTFGFDPGRHIRQDKNGLWEWADAPLDMQAWAAAMFVSRNEDGCDGPTN